MPTICLPYPYRLLPLNEQRRLSWRQENGKRVGFGVLRVYDKTEEYQLWPGNFPSNHTETKSSVITAVYTNDVPLLSLEH